MSNGYNANVRANYVSYGTGMQGAMIPLAPHVNISSQSYQMNTEQPPVQKIQSYVPVQQSPPLQHTIEHDSFIKNDKAAITTGAVLSLAAILAMVFAPKRPSGPTLKQRYDSWMASRAVKKAEKSLHKAQKKKIKANIKAEKQHNKQQLKLFKMDFKNAKTLEDIQALRNKYSKDIIDKYEIKLQKKN